MTLCDLVDCGAPGFPVLDAFLLYQHTASMGIITQSLQNVKLSIYLYIYTDTKNRQKLILEDNGAELEEEVSHSIKIWSNLRVLDETINKT